MAANKQTNKKEKEECLMTAGGKRSRIGAANYMEKSNFMMRGMK